MTIGRLWAGHSYGTHIANIFLEIAGKDDELIGALSINELSGRCSTFSLQGKFDGEILNLSGPLKDNGNEPNNIVINGSLKSDGSFKGQWDTTVGGAGTFVLFPHDEVLNAGSKAETVPVFYSKRYNLPAVALNYNDIVNISEYIKNKIDAENVIIAITNGSERAMYLQDFKNLGEKDELVTVLRIVGQVNRGQIVERSISLEVGPFVNQVTVQGRDETWVLGQAEALKFELQPVVRAYASNFRKMGISVYQIIIAGAFVYMPSLQGVWSRFLFISLVVAVVIMAEKANQKFFKNADISLLNKRGGIASKVISIAISWLIATTAGVVAAVLALIIEKWYGG